MGSHRQSWAVMSSHGQSWALIGSHQDRTVQHDAMEPSVKVGRYLYWEGNVQRSFEIVWQESQAQLLFSQVVDGVASSGLLKRTKRTKHMRQKHQNASSHSSVSHLFGTQINDYSI